MKEPDFNSLLGPDGALAQSVSGYMPRAQQVALAEDIWRVVGQRGTLLAEAGTGTGKTYAYLIPAMLAPGRTLVSTGTKTLQDQLFYKDLPMVRGAVDPSRSVALLKGRGNYLCPYRLDKHTKCISAATSPRLLAELNRIREWYMRTATGDVNEVIDVDGERGLARLITSTADNCLGNECPRIAECPLYRARARALEADIIVINHHLLLADIALRDDNLASMLPAADRVIVDEAHQLADIARQFFGARVSSGQFVDLCRDCGTELTLLGNDDPGLASRLHNLEASVERLNKAIGALDSTDLETVLSAAAIGESIEAVDIALAELAQCLETARERSRFLAYCHQRALRLWDNFAMLTEPVALDEDYAHWLQIGEHGFVLHMTPVSVAEELGAHIRASGKAWIFTSATLTVDGGFSHFKTALGLPDAEETRHQSPYAFAEQVKGWLPAALPSPGDDAHTHALVAACLPVIERVRGRTFFLFTSFRALNVAAACLADRGIACLMQGQMAKTALLKRFRSIPHCVLLATHSFWEGVDVRGANLQCLIIDKLPFSNPDDPLARARIRAIHADGGNAFMEYQVPEAAIALRQGFGRLIREDNDRGLFILGDPRVATRNYGRIFMATLPRFPWLDDQAAAIDYVEALPVTT